MSDKQAKGRAARERAAREKQNDDDLMQVIDDLRDCPHTNIVANKHHDDGSIDGKCQDCGEEGFPIRDVAYEQMEGLEPARLRCFVLHHGKHEEQSWASLIFTHEEGFERPLDAMKALRATLTKYVRDSAKPPKACCAKMAEDARFCPTCGRQREPAEALDSEVAGRFVDLFGQVYDGTHDLWEAFEAGGWEHGKLGKPEETCTVVNVDRWLEEEGSYMEATFHDDTRWSTYDERES